MVFFLSTRAQVRILPAKRKDGKHEELLMAIPSSSAGLRVLGHVIWKLERYHTTETVRLPDRWQEECGGPGPCSSLDFLA